MVYKNEDRVLTDLIYQFKEIREFPPSIQKVLVAQMHFKSVLDVTIINEKELEKL